MTIGVQRYTGCSLEVFDGVDSAELDYAKDMTMSSLVKLAKQQGQERLVRRALVGRTVIATDISADGLDHYLDKVDDAFESTSRAVGATVIDHQWGLVPRRSILRGNYYPAQLEHFGIADYLLAVEVPIVTGLPVTMLPQQDRVTLFNRLMAAKEAFVAEHGWFAYDVYDTRQFTLLRDANNDTQLLMHDVDPVTKDFANDF